MPFNATTFLAQSGPGRRIVAYKKNQPIFSQGDNCEGMFYIQKGRVKISVASQQGKEAVVAILGTGDFIGEGCLAGQHQAITTATVLTSETLVLHIERLVFQETLHSEQAFADLFLRYVLSRNINFEEDLIQFK